jgi:hypothetical protein
MKKREEEWLRNWRKYKVMIVMIPEYLAACGDEDED